MTDPIADSASATSTPGIEEIKAQLLKELGATFDDRAKGFQRVISAKDERLTALERELKQLKTASLSPEEMEELELQEKDQRIADLESRLELKDLASEYGDEMPYFERLLSAETAQDQLNALREFRKALTAQSTEPAPAEPEQDLDVPDVDPNAAQTRSTRFAGQMTDEMADSILGGFGRQVQASFTQRRR